MAAPRVLILDDEPFQLKLLSRQLANLGLDRVDTFTSGQAALALLEQQASDVQMIFLDLNMPGMDGVEFIRRLVDIHYTSALVLVSGEDERILDTSVRLARAHHLNVLGHVNKPVQPETIRALLKRWRNMAPKTAGEARKRYSAAQVRHAVASGEWGCGKKLGRVMQRSPWSFGIRWGCGSRARS